MLSCKELTLKNNYNVVFRKLSFTALPGSLIVVNGGNGSGKTCLFKMILGLIPESGGKITWNDIDIKEDINMFRQNISFISAQNAIKDEMTVYDNLKFWVDWRGEKELLTSAIRYFRLDDLLDMQVSGLSSGQKRRVELAKLLIAPTNLWLLDEPDTNLDNKTRNRLIHLIKVRVNEGGVVIMATHNNNDLGFGNFIRMEDFA
jgi:heme exporter protein A